MSTPQVEVQESPSKESEDGEVQSSDGEVPARPPTPPPKPKKKGGRKKGKGKKSKRVVKSVVMSVPDVHNLLSNSLREKGGAPYLVYDEVVALAMQKFEQAEAAKRRVNINQLEPGVPPPFHRSRRSRSRESDGGRRYRSRSRTPGRWDRRSRTQRRRDHRSRSPLRRGYRRSRSRSMTPRRRTSASRGRSRSRDRDRERRYGRHRPRSYDRGYREASYERGSRRSKVDLPGKTLGEKWVIPVS